MIDGWLTLTTTYSYNTYTSSALSLQIHNGPPHPSNFGYAYAKSLIDIQHRYVACFPVDFCLALNSVVHMYHHVDASTCTLSVGTLVLILSRSLSFEQN